MPWVASLQGYTKPPSPVRGTKKRLAFLAHYAVAAGVDDSFDVSTSRYRLVEAPRDYFNAKLSLPYNSNPVCVILFLMEICILFDEEWDEPVDSEWYEKVIRRILELEKVPDNIEMGVAVKSAEDVDEVSNLYLKDGQSHDVLSFALDPARNKADGFVLPPDGVTHLGEIIISYGQAAIQADEHHHSIRTEIVLLTIHGILHLLGYDHIKARERNKMQKREAEIFKTIEGEFA